MQQLCDDAVKRSPTEHHSEIMSGDLCNAADRVETCMGWLGI